MVRRDLTLLPWGWESSEKPRDKGSQLACDVRGKTWLGHEMVSASHWWWWYKMQQACPSMLGWKVCLNLIRRSACWPAVLLEPQSWQAQMGGGKPLVGFGWDKMDSYWNEGWGKPGAEEECTVAKDNGESFLCGLPFLLVQFLLVLRSIKHWLLNLL